jgi:hypothetical protein
VSDSERPDVTAFRELETLVRHLGDELASFRRRALQAEARTKELESASEGMTPAEALRLRKLEDENAELKKRLDSATERTRQMLERMRFLRQQQERPVASGGGPRRK